MKEEGKLPDGYVETDGREVRRFTLGDWLVALAILFALSGGFAFGYLYGKESGAGDRVYIENVSAAEEPGEVAGAAIVSEKTVSATATVPKDPTPVVPVPEGGMYVASKSGETYHLPWCGSAKNIKEENRIWFSSKAEAEAAGYRPAKNCKGI